MFIKLDLIGILKPGKLGIPNGNGSHKVLGAPVHLGSMAANLKNNMEEMKSIWVVSRDDTLVSKIFSLVLILSLG